MDSRAEHIIASPNRQTDAPTRLLSAATLSDAVKAFDFVAAVSCAVVAHFIYLVAILGEQESAEFGRLAISALMGGTFFVVGFNRIGAYRFGELSRFRAQIARIALVWFCTLSLLLVIAFVAKISESYSRGWAISWATSTLGVLALSRLVLRSLIARWTRLGVFARRVAIIGAGELGRSLIDSLQRSGSPQVSIVGVFDDRATRSALRETGPPLVGTADDLLSIARRTVVDDVIIALPLGATARIKAIVDKLSVLPVDLRLSAQTLEAACPIRKFDQAIGVSAFEIVERPLKNWSGITKWLEDRILSALLLLVFGPAMLLIALAIKLDSRGPVLFRQRRYGYNNELFNVYKFRTLRIESSDPDASRLVTQNDERLTRLGGFLRRYSLDELPQFLNVLKGDMSIVGPRPHATLAKAGDRFYQDVVEAYLARYKVKPGVTGWAQVNGWRGETNTYEKIRARVEHDIHYIDNWSIWFDLKIICKTAFVALWRT